MESPSIIGVIIAGHNRGTSLGFPTINIESAGPLPPHGIYAGWAELDSQKFMAAVHIGPVPVYGEETISVEAHLIGFSGDAYGKSVTLTCVELIRGVENFSNVELLRAQIEKDVARVKETLKGVE